MHYKHFPYSYYKDAELKNPPNPPVKYPLLNKHIFILGYLTINR